MKKTYVIKDEVGLHARPASVLVNVANRYPNEISISHNGKTVSLKSIMIVMSLGVPANAEITIEVLGDKPEVIHQELEAVLVQHEVI